ncbi:MAG: alkaline phosphatase D family protein, partial [Myxococcota bacterium]
MEGFSIEPAQTLVGVGSVGPRSGLLWARSPYRGVHRVEVWRREDGRGVGEARVPGPADEEVHALADGTWVQRLDRDGGFALAPRTDYGYRVLAPGGVHVGEGCFRTAPDPTRIPPQTLRFAAMSCNQPFDDQGAPDPDSLSLIDRCGEAFGWLDVDRVFMLGDQVYADLPQRRSLFDESYFGMIAPLGRDTLFDCTREEVRTLYQERHRLFWSLDGMREVQRNWSCALVIDDHELVDNFGSAPDHATGQFANIRQGALDAAYDFQLARALGARGPHRPAHFAYGEFYGPVAHFHFDLRSEKKNIDGVIEVISDHQHEAFSRFLARANAYPVLFLSLSVPLLHIPDWMVDAGVALTGLEGDAADRWSFQGAAPSRDALLQTLLR